MRTLNPEQTQFAPVGAGFAFHTALLKPGQQGMVAFERRKGVADDGLPSKGFLEASGSDLVIC